MNDFFILWLSLSLSGSLVAFALFLLKPALQRFSKTWQYYLWLLVVLRLLVPFSPDTSIVGELFDSAQTRLTMQADTAQTVPNHISQAAPSPDEHDLAYGGSPQAPVRAAVFSSLKEHIWGALWLLVAVALFVYKLHSYLKFLKMVKSDSRPAVNSEYTTALQALCAEMGIHKRIPICINALVPAPMLIGSILPTILLPNESIPSSELLLILRHELTHYRRRDFLYKWLVEIAVCLHWFNPLVYWVRKQISRDCEYSCDEAVVSKLGVPERQAYGDTLLNSIVVFKAGGASVVTLSLNEDGKLIQKRLLGIMRYQKKPKWITFVAAVFTAVLLCGTVVAGAYTELMWANLKPKTDFFLLGRRLGGNR